MATSNLHASIGLFANAVMKRTGRRSSSSQEDEPLRVVYTKHAKIRMRQRRVTKAEVALTLRKPFHRSRLRDEPFKWEFSRDFRNETLHIIAYRRRKSFKVKTVYFFIAQVMAMKITVDRSANAAYVKLRAGRIAKTKKSNLKSLDVLLDYDKAGDVIGWEVLN